MDSLRRRASVKSDCFSEKNTSKVFETQIHAGEYSKYTNVGYIVLGAIIENVSG